VDGGGCGEGGRLPVFIMDQPCRTCGSKIPADAVPVAGPPSRRNRQHGRPRYDVAFGRLSEEVDYTPEELEFMTAMQRYKDENRKPFPTWSEVLKVVLQLGYAKKTS
jgi:hypothetical protein